MKSQCNATDLLSPANVVGEKLPDPVQTGLLVAEPYSWKSLVSGNPILRVRTTGIRAVVLALPPGYVRVLYSCVYACGLDRSSRDSRVDEHFIVHNNVA